jgi:hypothetical protein
VRDRTSISAYLAALYSLLRIVPSQPQKNPSGIEMIPGLLSGNQLKSASLNSAVGPPETTGEKMTSSSAETRPP